MSTNTARWIKGINMCAETLGLAAQLVETTRQRAKTVSNEAGRITNAFRNDAASRVEGLGKSAAKRLRTRTSPGTRAIQFCCGVGLGLAAGVLFAPSTGKETREKLVTNATRLVNRAPEVSSSY